MALKKFARRDVILPAAVFLLTFAAALFSLRLLSLNQEKDERLRAVYAAESTISRVSSQLNRYLAESDFIKKYIESGHVLREEEFAGISGNMQDGSSVIKTHELAKDGVVSQVYPVAGNEAAIGLDVLHNPARKKEANLARNSGMYTIAGPFELVQGGTGALLFDPIYTDSKKGERSFWGFSILVLQWDNFMEEVELDKMEDAGYRYQIWKKDPYTGEKIVIAESEEDFPGNALEVACSVPNDTWYFEIIPKAGWFSNQQLSLSIAIAAIIGMMSAYACWELMNRHRKDLQHEAALEKSAQEARAANEAKTRFLFNMSHDIRTPMNAIIGFSELLEKHIDEKDKVLDYTEKIRSSSAFLLSLINYVLEMARIESKVIGTGLGLPIVKALVEWMHGSIDVQSKLGAGTTVTITLGFPLADEVQKRVEEQDAEGGAAQLKGCRILLAEDNDLNAEIVVTILEESGLTVERTADGELCVEALKAHPAGYYDAILMDIQMPNMDGYQAAKIIRDLSGNYRTIPIIAMTANAFDEDRQKALSVGMDAHLAKPVDVERLFGILRNVIR